MQLNIDLYPFEPFANRVWELRHKITSYDAWYVAVAEALNVPRPRWTEAFPRPGRVKCEFLTPGA